MYDDPERQTWSKVETTETFRSLAIHDDFRKRSEDYANSLAEASKRAHESSPPLFVPTLVSLRRTIFKSLSDRLLQLESEIALPDLQWEVRQEKNAEAIQLLMQMDQMVESEVRRMRLEDPDYADARSLNIVHFESQNNASTQSADWIMLSKAWGQSSRTIVEPAEAHDSAVRSLSEYHESQLKARTNVSDITELRPWSFRKKTTTERQWKTLKYHADGSVWFQYKIDWIWKTVLSCTFVILIIFYAVAVIATGAEFTRTFAQYFFWIALIWSLCSSTLLTWLVLRLGGSSRDAVSAFLTGLAIWLVVIQIGQTHIMQQFGMAQVN